jgi:FAD/FMN-containing dehydrogenase
MSTVGRGRVVNDVHSRLTATTVAGIVRPAGAADVPGIVRRAVASGRTLSICGARHAMGGQQFGAGTVLIDTTRLRRVIDLDLTAGEVEVEAGMQWPGLIRALHHAQPDARRAWGIRQKQTGADRLTLGGALAANIHGRGLRLPPFVTDVAAFVLVDARGEPRRCSRTEHTDLFRLAIGGYGLFGVVTSIRLRLARRAVLERVVGLGGVDELPGALLGDPSDRFVYGDFQFSIDPASADFLCRGVLSRYRELGPDAPAPRPGRQLSSRDWRALVRLAHVDKREAFVRYAAHYLATSGQRYWSDTHQLGPYLDGYHEQLDAEVGGVPASELITELFVPRGALASFMRAAASDLRRHAVEVVYGTVRLVEAEQETVLAWARERWACIVFNLHTPHTAAGRAHTEAACRRLIDIALDHGGSFYLTYHRAATLAQIERAYPRFREFLAAKRRDDPAEIFRSDWYDHHRAMVDGEPRRVTR